MPCDKTQCKWWVNSEDIDNCLRKNDRPHSLGEIRSIMGLGSKQHADYLIRSSLEKLRKIRLDNGLNNC